MFGRACLKENIMYFHLQAFCLWLCTKMLALLSISIVRNRMSKVQSMAGMLLMSRNYSWQIVYLWMQSWHFYLSDIERSRDRHEKLNLRQMLFARFLHTKNSDRTFGSSCSDWASSGVCASLRVMAFFARKVLLNVWSDSQRRVVRLAPILLSFYSCSYQTSRIFCLHLLAVSAGKQIRHCVVYSGYWLATDAAGEWLLRYYLWGQQPPLHAGLALSPVTI